MKHYKWCVENLDLWREFIFHDSKCEIYRDGNIEYIFNISDKVGVYTKRQNGIIIEVQQYAISPE